MVETAATTTRSQAERDQENADAVHTVKIDGGLRPLARAAAATRRCTTSFAPNLQNIDTR